MNVVISILVLLGVTAAILLLSAMRWSLKRVHIFLKNRKEFFVFLGSIIALGYTFFEYNDAKEKTRIEKTLDYLKDYRGDFQSDHKIRIEFARSLMLELSRCKNGDPKLQPVCNKISNDKDSTAVGDYVFDLLLRDSSGNLIPNGKNEYSQKIVNSIVYGAIFFNDLSACAIQNLCSREVSCANMALNVYTFNLNFKGFFKRYKEIWHDDPTYNIDPFLKLKECKSEIERMQN